MVTPQPTPPDRDAPIPLIPSIAKHRRPPVPAQPAPAATVSHARAHAHAAPPASPSHPHPPHAHATALQPGQTHPPPHAYHAVAPHTHAAHPLPPHAALHAAQSPHNLLHHAPLPRPASTPAAWAVLPPPLRARILAHLKLPDLYALRLAGLTARDAAAAHELRAQLRARIATLDLVRRAMTPDAVPYAPDSGLDGGPGGPGGGGGGDGANGLHFMSPVAFAGLAMLSVVPAPAALAAVAAEMACLADLTVVPPPPSRGLRRLTEVPAALARCAALQSVCLARHDFARVPPPLLRVAGLRALDLSGNARLHELPTDIGARLPRLESIKLYDTRVTALPASLLDTVNANHERKPHDFVDPHAVGVTKTMFPPGYLERVICKSRYPRLAYNMRFILE